MERIMDVLTDGRGRTYSLTGLKRLLRAVTKDGGAVIIRGEVQPSKRKEHSGKI